MTKKMLAVISRDSGSIALMENILGNLHALEKFGNVKPALDYIYNAIPNLVIFDAGQGDPEDFDLLNNLKSDPLFNHLPVLAIIDRGSPAPRWGTLFIEDYLWRKDIGEDIAGRVELSILRSERIVEVNPLSRLPGNISVNRTIQRLLDDKKSFSVAYADLDNFKPYNDYYGFSRGDEVIKMTARLILNIVKNGRSQESFVGHIGGDDFLFIVDPAIVDETAGEIVAAFDRIIATFYDREDWNRGYIESTDRRGTKRQFPPVSISIGITSTGLRTFIHYGQLTEAVSEMKKYAKRFKGSCFKSDKRHEQP